MDIQICQLNTEFAFYQDSKKILTVQAVELHLKQKNNQIKELYLKFEVDLLHYQQIETEELFQLRQDLQGRMIGNDFVADLPLQLTILLNPDLIHHLTKYATDIQTIANYLLKLSQAQSNAKLVQVENWVVLSVKQQQPQGETGFRTFWDYLNVSQIFTEKQDDITGDLVSAGIIEFFQDSATARLIADSADDSTHNEQTTQATNQLIQTLLGYAPAVLNQDISASEPIATAITNLFQESLQSQLSNIIESGVQEHQDLAPFYEFSETFLNKTTSSPTENSLLSTTIEFFQQDDWIFEQVESQPILRMLFQGDNEKYTCLAVVKEELEQFIFYSISSIKVSPEKRSALAELLMRLNHSLTMGNFDLDFRDGEIRFKNSIDVEGSELDLALIKNIVYTNVLTMDKYFPEILAVIN